MKYFYIKHTLLFLIMGIPALVFSQTPTNQDCLGAITVCQEIYTQLNSYSGTGNYPNEIPTTGNCPNNCLNSGEKNDVWYIFTVNTGGTLGFKITPINQSNDYDWAVYSLNNYDCEDIYAHSGQMQVSCNYSGTPGETGATLLSGNSCEGASGNKFCKLITVEEGDIYVLNISNFSSSQAGYTLDFGLSSANIFDNIPPSITTIYTDDIHCGTTSIDFEFNERVLCNSLQSSDFSLTGPGGPYSVTSVVGETCLQGGTAEINFTMQFAPPIYESGTYSINITPLSFIKDDCGNTASISNNEFDIELNSPNIDAGQDQNIAYGANTQLNSTVSGGSGNFTFDWMPASKLVNNTIEDPATINLTESTNYSVIVEDESSNCRSSDEVMVNIVGGPMSVVLYADIMSVCSGATVNIGATPTGGAGGYTYLWTSDPPGINYSASSIIVNPTVTTTYFLEITDGYTTLNDHILITVYETPIANAGPDQEINMGTYTYLDGAGTNGQSPYTYNWSPPDFIFGDITVPNPRTSILTANQIYMLNIVDDHGCIGQSSEVTVKISGSALGAQPIANPSEICIGGESTLISNVSGGGGGSYTMEWRTEDGSWQQAGDNVIVNPTSNTKYFLKVDDGFTTKDSIPLYLPVNPLPIVDLIPDGMAHNGDTIAACVRDTVTLNAGNPSNPNDMLYLWSNGWGEQYLTTKTNGNLYDFQTFNVLVTNNITGCKNGSSISIIFNFNECGIGIEEKNTFDSLVIIYPNPNNGFITIETKKPIGTMDVELIDILGKTVYKQHFENIGSPGWSSQIDLQKLPKGIYLLNLTLDQESISYKIIKDRN